MNSVPLICVSILSPVLIPTFHFPIPPLQTFHLSVYLNFFLTALLRKGGFKAQTCTHGKLSPTLYAAVDDSARDTTRSIVYRPSDFSKRRHGCMTKDELMTKWYISTNAAEKTLQHIR